MGMKKDVEKSRAYVFSDAAGCALALYEPWAGVGHAIGRVLDDRPDRPGHRVNSDE